jgi:clan AA aspartic protease
MGYVQATVALSNPRHPHPHPHPLEVTALADTGALMLRIPEHVVVQLQLDHESMREVTVADGRVIQVPYVGPVRVAYEGRSCFVGALVLGDSVLLGAVPMEDMDLIVHPARQRLEPDPRDQHPPCVGEDRPELTPPADRPPRWWATSS